MPSTVFVRLRERATTQRNVTIYLAILVAVPLASAFNTAVGGAQGGFLLLMTLAVGVPSAYDGYWPAYDATWKAVAWILAACAVVTVEFIGLYLAGTDLLSLSPFVASIVAFLVVDFGNLAWLSVMRRR
ncbi:hypothetical protein [Halomicrococcus gelatinilyticus]|uniref:hypothetical protein n=1 Tax=Halomicrococcus gelatinilyticus TaxID=1702103 RepID=UPI002E122CBB